MEASERLKTIDFYDELAGTTKLNILEIIQDAEADVRAELQAEIDRLKGAFEWLDDPGHYVKYHCDDEWGAYSRYPSMTLGDGATPLLAILDAIRPVTQAIKDASEVVDEG